MVTEVEFEGLVKFFHGQPSNSLRVFLEHGVTSCVFGLAVFADGADQQRGPLRVRCNVHFLDFGANIDDLRNVKRFFKVKYGKHAAILVLNGVQTLENRWLQLDPRHIDKTKKDVLEGEALCVPTACGSGVRA